VGVDIGKGTLEKLANDIKLNTDPKLYPKITVEKVRGKNIVVVETKKVSNEPVLAFGRAYKRVGNSTHRMSREEYKRILFKLHRDKLHFDNQVCKEATLDDIDEEKVKWFLGKARYERNFSVQSEVHVEGTLKRLKLMKNGKLTNAAVLLFGKNPQRFFLQGETRCARFKGIEPLEFIDMKVFGGNVINQREDALEFTKEHIKLHAKIVGTERVEKWEYPIEAIREAITNAICHRDYRISSNVQVRIFDDRIEIWGVGPLPEPLKIEDLKKKHDSILRNPLIGKCFFLIKYIEQWGTGTNKIIKECLSHGLPEPLFEEITGSLVVTFRKYRVSEEIIKELSREERIIIDFIKENGKISRKECVKLLDTSSTTAFRYFKSLERKKIIKMMGKGKNIYYILV